MIDLTKPVQTRDGRAARILCTDVKTHNYPVAALVTTGENENVEMFTTGGRYIAGQERDTDLVNIPERRTFFVSEGGSYAEQDGADRVHGDKWSTFKIVVEGNTVVSSENVRPTSQR